VSLYFRSAYGGGGGVGFGQGLVRKRLLLDHAEFQRAARHQNPHRHFHSRKLPAYLRMQIGFRYARNRRNIAFFCSFIYAPMTVREKCAPTIILPLRFYVVKGKRAILLRRGACENKDTPSIVCVYFVHGAAGN
jgi:hypothetical protein